MSIASKYNGLDRKKLLWPHDIWPEGFQGVVKQDPEFAGALAHLMFNTLETPIKRPRDIEKLCNTLKDGIEWVYPYTGAHKAAFKTYLLKLERMMAIEDDPERPLNQAIERANKRRRT